MNPPMHPNTRAFWAILAAIGLMSLVFLVSFLVLDTKAGIINRETGSHWKWYELIIVDPKVIAIPQERK